MHIVLSSLLYSIDSLFLGAAIGSISPRNSFGIAAAVGLADGLAGLAGLAVAGFGLPTWVAGCAPSLLAAYAALLFLAAPRFTILAMSRLGISLLLVLLSLDNFIGAALETSAGSFLVEAAVMAVASFLMAWSGCSTGAALARQWPGFVKPLVSGATFATAVAMILS